MKCFKVIEESRLQSYIVQGSQARYMS